MNLPFTMFLKIATRTPDVFLSVARETLRCRAGRYLDYRFGGGRALAPRYVDLKLTNRCNLRCHMCGQWGDHGVFRNADKKTLREEIPLERLKALVREVAPHRTSFYLWGGEPFLYGDLIPLIAEIKAHRLVCAMNTNGTFLARAAEDLVRLRADNILVSVDGPREVHDRVRNVPGTYDRVMAGVERILALKREGGPRPYITFVITINRDNTDSFTYVYDLAERMGVDFVGLQFGTFTTPQTGAAYEARLHDTLACRASSWRGFLSDRSDLDVPAVEAGLRRVKGRKWPFGTYFIPDLSPEQVPGYYAGAAPVNGCKICIVPWMRADILPNGDVYPCIDFPDYIVGNIHGTPLMELWNSPRYVAFRRELRKGLFPICGRCSTLYEF